MGTKSPTVSSALDEARDSLSRRGFLISGAAAAASFVQLRGLSLWPTLTSARAAGLGLGPTAGPASDGGYFLVLRTEGNGGMDCTLGLDPWLKPIRPAASDIFIEYRDDEIARVEGASGPRAFGPAAAALVPHARDCLTINGILVSENDNGHDGAMMYMSTGDGSGKAPDLVGELSLSCPAGPYGILATAGAYGADRRFNRGRFGDIVSALGAPDPAANLVPLLGDGPRLTPLQRAQGAVVDADDVTQALLRTLGDWLKAGQPTDDEHVAAAAFLSGAARQAQIQIKPSSNLDTHSGHAGNHLRGQKSVWDRVAAIFALFKSIPHGNGGSLFDRTTFYVYSEFSRTPALDAAGGKNHNPLVNSALLAGRGIRGGQTIGASRLIGAAESRTRSSYHIASPIDWATGLPSHDRKNASFIFPEHVIRTCAIAAGADPAQFRSVGPKVPPIPGAC